MRDHSLTPSVSSTVSVIVGLLIAAAGTGLVIAALTWLVGGVGLGTGPQ